MSVLSEDHGFAQQDDAPATRDTGQLLLVGLVVLALAASVIMMLTGNINLLKVALLAALWAAVFGIFLTYFYRNKLSEQKLEHENQIEQARLAFHAEQAARELELEQRITEKTNDATQETLDKIKDQLDNLRSQLEMLSGVSFEEPTMIRAEAHRIKEMKEISASDGVDYGPVEFGATTPEPEMVEEYRNPDDVPAESEQFNNARFGTYPTFTGSGSNATDMTDVFSHVPDPEPEFDPNAEWDESKHFSEFPVETATNNSNVEDSAVDGEPVPTDYDLPSYSTWEGSGYASENSEEAEVEEPTGSFPAGASTSGTSSGAHSSPDTSSASTSGYGADFSAARLQNIYGRSTASSQKSQDAQESQTSGRVSHRGSDSFAFGNSSNTANTSTNEADSRDTTSTRSNDANTPNRATYPNFAMPSGSQESSDYSGSIHDNRGSHRSGGHSADSNQTGFNQTGFSYSNYGSGGYSSSGYSTPAADSNNDSAATVYDSSGSSGSSYASPSWSSTSSAVGDSATTDSTDSTDSTGRQQDTGSWRQRVAAGSGSSSGEGGGWRRKPSESEPEPQNHRGSHRRPEQEDEDTRHGRRRRDESGGLSVADLLRRNDG